ncbi:MAG: hypothetical protein KGJ33_01825 [Patescibacteria group bacterium]|nr:hypothetical protein [Patescibacteria group bacterium]
MHTYTRVCISLTAAIVAIFIGAPGAEASTIIDGADVVTDTTWTDSDGPYVVTNTVRISQAGRLRVASGAEIIASSSLEGSPIFQVEGLLEFDGARDKPVSVKGSGQIYISKGTTTAAYTAFSLDGGIFAYKGVVAISTSTISDAWAGVHANGSRISIRDSYIRDNTYGLIVENPAPVFQVRNLPDVPYGVGGAGNAFDEGDLDAGVTIADSSLTHNTEAAVQNKSADMVVATHNWWGSSAGPTFDGANKLIGPVAYSPWQEVGITDSCCSSVLFLPGLEGTRLYRPEALPLGLGTVNNRLWEPNRTADVQKLYLDSHGSSTDKTIYSTGPVDAAFGIFDVYGSFMSFLDTLVKDDTISEWKAFGYDWRKPISDVVMGSERKATTTESLMAIVEDMASRSKTGKVTLIAHSNGGLVAKYLIAMLADRGRSSFIDTVISVAVPYLGTPEAIAGLLHGDDQSIAAGLIVSAGTARALGQNMPSAYSLLPSISYFTHVFGPTVAFASTTIVGLNDGSYPQIIDTHNAQNAFLADKASLRQLSPANTYVPARANSTLLAAADALHAMLDPMSWPQTIATWAIIGWNKITTDGITYRDVLRCLPVLGIGSCVSLPGHAASTTLMGDGTVVAPSAAYNDGTPISLDLGGLSADERKDYNHVNILESSTTQSVIGEIIKKGNEARQPIASIPNVSLGEPDYSKEATYLVVSTHSPVELNIYDARNRHTGPISQPAGIDEPLDDSLYSFYETGIPGSNFTRHPGADGGADTSIYLPENDGQTYSVVMNGTDFGFVSFDIEARSGDRSLGKATYTMEPVTPFTIATTTVGGIGPASASSQMSTIIASTTPSLHLDVDGDGKSDFEAVPGNGLPAGAMSATDTTAISNAANAAMTQALVKLTDRLMTPERKTLIFRRLQTIFSRLKFGRRVTLDTVLSQNGGMMTHFGHIDWKSMTAQQKSTLSDFVDKMSSGSN